MPPPYAWSIKSVALDEAGVDLPPKLGERSDLVPSYAISESTDHTVLLVPDDNHGGRGKLSVSNESGLGLRGGTSSSGRMTAEAVGGGDSGAVVLAPAGASVGIDCIGDIVGPASAGAVVLAPAGASVGLEDLGGLVGPASVGAVVLAPAGASVGLEGLGGLVGPASAGAVVPAPAGDSVSRDERIGLSKVVGAVGVAD